MSKVINGNEILEQDLEDFIKHADHESLMKLVKKHGSPYRLTNRGIRYYTDLTNKYLQGLKIGDDKLLLLCGIHSFGSRNNQLDESISNEIYDEIAIKIGVDMGNNQLIDSLLILLIQNGHLESNPDFNEEFNKLCNEVVTMNEDNRRVSKK